jgi:uncharacterized protein
VVNRSNPVEVMISPNPHGAAVASAEAALLQQIDGWTPVERAALVEILRRASGTSAISQLALLPAAAILEAADIATLDRVAATPAPTAASVHPAIVLIMKATRLCNLRCTYCHFWRSGPDQVMSFEVMATAIRDALATPGVRHVEFTWHGGEVTLLPPDFLRRAIWLQEHFRRPDQQVTNAVQTNGTRLDAAWMRLFRAYEISVGISLDGPPEVHDRTRVDRRGDPTSDRVRAGLALLREHRIKHGVLMVVGEDVMALGAARTLAYLLDLGVPSVGLLNVIPENRAADEDLRGHYLPWPRYVTWLRELFDLWWPVHAARLHLRELADLVGKVGGEGSRTCLFAGDCHGRYLTIEPNGEVSACDKYVDASDYVLGPSLREAFAGTRLPDIRRRESAAVADLSGCRWFGVCAGGCPHDRRLSTQYLHGVDGCCGLAPLLDDMAAKTHGVRHADHPSASAPAALHERN